MEPLSDTFRSELDRLFTWRRDVRRFRTDPVDEAVLARGLSAFALGPSVGLSEPWRLVRIQSDAARQKALSNFEAANQRALAGFEGDKAELYAGLKLSGMRDAPIQLAIYCDDTTPKGHGLGAETMPEMRRYSVICAIMQMWLALAAEGVGMGWVSIIDPDKLSEDLNAPKNWTLVAYLCIGWPERHTDLPELQQAGWETRADGLTIVNA
ncbi:5,6-dimethylbenzimidazole synthase [Aestuariibius sp. HNIBRBA575]|uniref:5,6-dimethylbenzimidazole synthase n=1 Tax=Aestuariibius sp. HNIBRBA575 TaxID=3233343 RepID=UPI0034A2B049